ncbi:MAG: DoxX family protein [Chloroflexota bacterium]|nr:DoxX family protein [Chloroflexota bacterium]
MDRTLWIAAGLLAAVYLFSGAVKLILPKEKLATAPGGGWVNDFSADAVRVIGVLEILGALGLVLPAVTGIAPLLTPLAAAGLAVLMVGAAITRLRRHEPKPMLADLVYLALAAFVAWGRFFGPAAFVG